MPLINFQHLVCTELARSGRGNARQQSHHLLQFAFPSQQEQRPIACTLSNTTREKHIEPNKSSCILRCCTDFSITQTKRCLRKHHLHAEEREGLRVRKFWVIPWPRCVKNERYESQVIHLPATQKTMKTTPMDLHRNF